jgi:arylformamidase
MTIGFGRPTLEFDSRKIAELFDFMERNYSLRSRHPEREGIYADYARRSAQFRDSHPGFQRIPYADASRCVIDWFPARGATAPGPTLVFIHGGFWRALDASVFSFLARHYVAAGVHVAMLGYELAPKVTLQQIVDQAAAAIQRLRQGARELGIDPARLSVSGHSAGGHLSAILASMAPQDLMGEPLVCAVPISGIFALEPLLLTSVNHDVRLTAADAVRLSPMHLQKFHVGRFIIAVGEGETEGFIGQSCDFHRTVAQAGLPSDLTRISGRNHFDILEDFAHPDAALFQSVLSAVTAAAPHRSDALKLHA